MLPQGTPDFTGSRGDEVLSMWTQHWRWDRYSRNFAVACGSHQMNIINALQQQVRKLVEALATLTPTRRTLLTMESPEETGGEDAH